MRFAPGQQMDQQRTPRPDLRPGFRRTAPGRAGFLWGTEDFPLRHFGREPSSGAEKASHIIQDTSRYVVRTVEKTGHIEFRTQDTGPSWVTDARTMHWTKMAVSTRRNRLVAPTRRQLSQRHRSLTPGRLDRQTFNRSELIIGHGLEPNSFLYSWKNIL
jgi:hypothetical protein